MTVIASDEGDNWAATLRSDALNEGEASGSDLVPNNNQQSEPCLFLKEGPKKEKENGSSDHLQSPMGTATVPAAASPSPDPQQVQASTADGLISLSSKEVQAETFSASTAGLTQQPPVVRRSKRIQEQTSEKALLQRTQSCVDESASSASCGKASESVRRRAKTAYSAVAAEEDKTSVKKFGNRTSDIPKDVSSRAGRTRKRAFDELVAQEEGIQTAEKQKGPYHPVDGTGTRATKRKVAEPKPVREGIRRSQRKRNAH